MSDADRPTAAADGASLTTLQELLEAQHELQVGSFDVDPCTLTGEARIAFVFWNAFALEDEIHEAMGEVSWKPWASAEFFNREQYLKEMVDAFHFFMNMLLAGGITAEEFAAAYFAKREVNADRQAAGYTGLEKCAVCGAALDDSDCTSDACAKREYC